MSSSVRVATYTRISTDEEHQPFSLEAQAQRLGSYIESQDSWQLVHRFTDQMSGSTLERPGLQQALAYARAKRYDMLLVYPRWATVGTAAAAFGCARPPGSGLRVRRRGPHAWARRCPCRLRP